MDCQTIANIIAKCYRRKDVDLSGEATTFVDAPIREDTLAEDIARQLAKVDMVDGQWKLLSVLKRMQDQDPGFTFFVDVDEDYNPQGVLWCCSWQRYKLLKFGDVLFLDSKNAVNNNKGWPYWGPTVITEEGKLRAVAHAITSTESHASVSWILTCLKKLNTNLEDQCRTVFTDAATEEYVILKSLPNTKHFVCAFHFYSLDLNKILTNTKCYQSALVKHMTRQMVTANTFHDFQSKWESLQSLAKSDESCIRVVTWLKRWVEDVSRWGKFERMRHLTLGKEGNSTAETTNAVITKAAGKQFISVEELLVCSLEVESNARKAEEERFSKFALYQYQHRLTYKCSNAAWFKTLFNNYSTFCADKFVAEYTQSFEYTCNIESNGSAESRQPTFVPAEFKDCEGISTVVATVRRSTSGHTFDRQVSRFLTSTGVRLSCCCGYSTELGIPCRHIIRYVITKYNDIPKEILPSLILDRWTRHRNVGHCKQDLAIDNINHESQLQDIDESTPQHESEHVQENSQPVVNWNSMMRIFKQAYHIAFRTGQLPIMQSWIEAGSRKIQQGLGNDLHRFLQMTSTNVQPNLTSEHTGSANADEPAQLPAELVRIREPKKIALSGRPKIKRYPSNKIDALHIQKSHKTVHRTVKCSFCDLTGHNVSNCQSLKKFGHRVDNYRSYQTYHDLVSKASAVEQLPSGHGVYQDSFQWDVPRGVKYLVIFKNHTIKNGDRFAFLVTALGRGATPFPEYQKVWKSDTSIKNWLAKIKLKQASKLTIINCENTHEITK